MSYISMKMVYKKKKNSPKNSSAAVNVPGSLCDILCSLSVPAVDCFNQIAFTHLSGAESLLPLPLHRQYVSISLSAAQCEQVGSSLTVSCSGCMASSVLVVKVYGCAGSVPDSSILSFLGRLRRGVGEGV